MPDATLEMTDIGLSAHREGLTLRVDAGERVALLGEDITWLERVGDVVTGHATPLFGRIALNGADCTGQPASRRDVGVVSARAPLFDHLDVADNVGFPLRARGMDRSAVAARVRHLAAVTRLETLLKARPAELTPQDDLRVRLARALAPDPALLILESPLSTLAPAAWRGAQTMLDKLLGGLRSSTLILTTERREALLLASRIGIVSDGQIVQTGDAATLFDRPEHLVVATRFGEANALAGHVLSIDYDVARIRLRDGAEAEAMAVPDLAVDSACVVCIRPDRISPHFGRVLAVSADDSDERPLLATLHDVRHMGDHLRLGLRLDDGSEMSVSRPPVQSRVPPRPGARVHLAWPAAQAVAFPMPRDLY